jgi:hypothetical protein
MPRNHLNEVKQQLSKQSPMCKPLTDHIPCANPSQTISRVQIHLGPCTPNLLKHPQTKHGVNTFNVSLKANTPSLRGKCWRLHLSTPSTTPPIMLPTTLYLLWSWNQPLSPIKKSPPMLSQHLDPIKNTYGLWIWKEHNPRIKATC